MTTQSYNWPTKQRFEIKQKEVKQQCEYCNQYNDSYLCCSFCGAPPTDNPMKEFIGVAGGLTTSDFKLLLRIVNEL
jgi:hypothetical protein